MQKLSFVAGTLAVAVLAGCGVNPGLNASLNTAGASSEFRADGVSKLEVVVSFNQQPSSLKYKVKKTIRGINATVLAVPSGMTPEAVISDVKANYSVRYAQTNSRVLLDAEYNDPRLKEQYSLNVTNAIKAWDVTKGDKNTTIAVIDTGVDANHPDLKNKIVSSWNVFNKTTTVKDGQGHGTHTAGIAAAAVGNGEGVAGVAPDCGLMIVQVLDERGSGSEQSIADGIVWAAEHGAKVMTMSLGLYKRSKLVEDALQFALDKDVVLCASAGNNNAMNDPEKAPHLPSTYPGVIEVAATDNLDKKASFSNWGTTVSVAAPGVNILSTVPGGYQTMSGTSMASPFAAGVAALIRSRHPEWNRDQVRKALEASVTDLGDKGFDKYFGYGRVDALQAVSK